MQCLAEKKIKEVEQKLYEEEHYRKLMQEKAAQLQSGLESNRILLQSLTPTSSPKLMKSKKSKTKQLDKKQNYLKNSYGQPHYKFSLGDVPFVVGKSAGPSHSVRANVQHVLHLMKQHNKLLCNDRVVSDIPLVKKQGSGRRSGDYSTSPREELCELLLTLQDEFGQMSFDHKELVKNIQEARTAKYRMDLERELDALEKKMEAKGDQICTVRRHQARLGKMKDSAYNKRTDGQIQDSRPLKGVNEVKVTTWQETETCAIRAKPGEKSRSNRQFLRDMQTLRTTLQKEDLCWDY